MWQQKIAGFCLIVSVLSIYRSAPCNPFVKGEGDQPTLILIYTMMHQHFVCPGSIKVCHLVQPVRVNRLTDMTCPAPLIELLSICLP